MKKNNYSSFAVLKYFFQVAFKCRPSYPILIFLTIILRAISPFLGIVFPSLIINELTKVDLVDVNLFNVIMLVSVFVLSEFVVNALNAIIYHHGMAHNENMVTKELKKIMGNKMMKMRFYHLENPEVLDQISKGQDGLFGYGNRLGGFQALIMNFINVVSYFITLFGVIFIISQVNILLVLILFAIVAIRLYVQNISKKLDIKIWEDRKRVNRENDYYSSLLVDFKYGKDIKLNNCKDLLINKNLDFIEDTYNFKRKQYKKYKLISMLDFLLNALIHVLTYGYVAYYFIVGDITIALYSLYVSSINSLVRSSYSIFDCLLNIKQNTKMMSEFKKFMDIDATYVEGKEKIDYSKPLVLEFKNVTFSYPGSKDCVLKNVNYKIDFKKKISIVGENGAGKSTFIKLLMRLYDPTEGVITLNGIDIKEYDINDYYGLFSVVFQDYQLVGFTLGENIASSDIYDEKRVESILEEVNFKARVYAGLSTSMMKYFDEKGVELSGGESQKVAIARSLYKGANVLILDEPTAALDPLAEFEIYNQFNKMTNNKTALYISHRLSSCRFCDEILVFEKGKIIQVGHHDSLINDIDGKYYKMFKAQAKYYQDNNIKEILSGVKFV